LDLTVEQKTAIITVTDAVLAVIARQSVTPVRE
jgi:hypothetical protein